MTGTATTLLGYDAQYTSTDTGLIYLRARVYDPATTQFLSVDPIAATTRAPYGYGADNPVNEMDPSGLSGCGSIAVISTICNGMQESGVSDVAAGALNVLTFGGSNKLAGTVFGFNSACANYGTGGEIGAVVGFGLGWFDGESEAELVASTGRTVASDLTEQLAMEEAMSNPTVGLPLRNLVMSDARWPAEAGWVKMAQNVNGVEIHYVLNKLSGMAEDFKFIGGGG